MSPTPPTPKSTTPAPATRPAPLFACRPDGESLKVRANLRAGAGRGAEDCRK